MTKRGLRGLYFLVPMAMLCAATAFPTVTKEGVEAGLGIALMAVRALIVPMVLGGVILRLVPAAKKCAVLPYFLGLLCGFPTGAQLVGELYGAGKITRKKAEQLLFFSNNCSLPFLIAFLGRRGILLFLLQLLPTLPFLFRLFFKKEEAARAEQATPPLTVALTGSLRQAGENLLYVCSCILFFTYLRHFICAFFQPTKTLESVLCLLFELTGGVIRQSEGFPLALVAAGVGFGGLSVQAQTAGLLAKSGLSCRSHVAGKVFLGLCMGAAGYFLEKGL